MKYLTNPWVLLIGGILIGAAYGKSIPGVSTIASKLPGSSAV